MLHYSSAFYVYYTIIVLVFLMFYTGFQKKVIFSSRLMNNIEIFLIVGTNHTDGTNTNFMRFTLNVVTVMEYWSK